MSEVRITPFGQSAVRITFAPRIDAVINAKAIAVASAIEAAGIAGVHDVVPTYRSVTIHFNPLTTDTPALYRTADAITRAAEAQPVDEGAHRRDPVTIPVCYGGDRGPDLADVARRSGLSESEVVAIHSSAEYRVFMMGFVPGFAYLGTLDPRIVAPRRANPRVKVAAGSVAIAGQQTAVYPLESPGGWQLIGWTPAVLFDRSRTPPFLLRAGDRVRFEAREHVAEVPRAAADDEPARPSIPSISVVRPGLLTTVQDGGRRGFQAWGLPESGPMDPYAHRVANTLVGNPDEAAALEITLTGPELQFDEDRTAAVAGAEFELFVSGEPRRTHEPIPIPAGGTLRFGSRRKGARAYLAIAGGIDVPAVLGSRSTHLTSGLGGFGGRALAAGDRLPLGTIGASTPQPRRAPERDQRSSRSSALSPETSAPAVIRVLPGPDLDWFAPEALAHLAAADYIVQPDSNRMGCRLDGAPLPLARGGDMISDATVPGAIQVLPSGRPVVLMVDRQTTGGYPILATVIASDFGVAGQLAPGDRLRFAVCDPSEAASALIARERSMLARAGAA